MTLPRGRPAGSEPPDEPAGTGSYAEQDDRALVGLVLSRDPDALEALYARYGRACYGLARRILTDEQLAQDVVQWTFARQLLTDGVAAPAGEGDVQVWPSSTAGSSVVCLSLSSPSGRALFEVPLAELAEFLGRTYASVPTGSEADHVDVDAELALLLWAEPET